MKPSVLIVEDDRRIAVLLFSALLVTGIGLGGCGQDNESAARHRGRGPDRADPEGPADSGTEAPRR